MYICYTVYATRSARICTEKLFLWVGEGALFFFLYRNWKKKDVTLRASCQTLSIFKILPMLTLMPKM